MSTHVSLTSLTSPQADSAQGGHGIAAARRKTAAGPSAQRQGSEALAALVARSLQRHLGVQADSFTYEQIGQHAPTIAVRTDAAPAAEAASATDASEADSASAAEAEPTAIAASEEAVAANDESTETATDDGEPASAAPTPGNGFELTGNEMLLRILASDSGDDNRIVMSFDGFKTWTDLGTDNQDLQATTSVAMPAGTQVEFGIVNGEGTLLRAGAGSLNVDGLEHARVDTDADGTLTIGFEDLTGGGDADFDDARIEIVGAQVQTATTVAAQQPLVDVAPSAPATAPDDAAVDDEVRSRHEMQATISQATLERNRQLLASLYILLPQDDTDPATTSQDTQDAQNADDAAVTAAVATQA